MILEQRLATLKEPPANWCCGRELQVSHGYWRSGPGDDRHERWGWWCPVCRRQRSLTAGTFLDRNRVPLRIWDDLVMGLQVSVHRDTLVRMYARLDEAGANFGRVSKGIEPYEPAETIWAKLLSERP